jgi:DNA-binding NarL/FixJ family response regulator
MPRIPLEKPRGFLIVDDHAMVRRGLRQVVVEEVSTCQSALDAVRLGEWAFVILDINQPDKNGPEVLKDLQALRPALRSLSLATMLKSNMRLAGHRTGDVGAAASEDHTKGDS